MNDRLETVLSADQLGEIVTRLAREISIDHPAGLVLVGVLNSSVPFIADLSRKLSVPCEVDFFALSRFAARGERAKIEKDLDMDVTGKDVVLAEEIVDTGLSSRFVVEAIEARGAQSISVCTLLNRPARRILPLKLRYVGAEVGDAFLVGFGLDYDQRYRNLPEIVAINPDQLDGDRAEFEQLAYVRNRAYRSSRERS